MTIINILVYLLCNEQNIEGVEPKIHRLKFKKSFFVKKMFMSIAIK
jgi:hypothetical protein